MSEALVIRLSRDLSAVQYLLVDAMGGRLGAVVNGTLSQSAALATNRRVVVLVPAVDVVFADPELPARNAARLAQLAPYAMEELLATEIDTMHFTVGKRGADGKTPVAAVTRELIEHWLSELQKVGLQADAIYSEASLLPSTGAGITLIFDQGLLYIRKIGSPSFVVDARPLKEAMHLALLGEPSDISNAEVIGDLQFYANQTDYESELTTVTELRESFPSLQVRLLPEGPLPLFALQIADASPLNLLSGLYERKSSLSVSLAPWRYAAVLLGIAVALQLTYGGLRLWQSVRAEKQLDAQIREVAQTLPGFNATNTSDVRKQFEARLNTLQHNGARGDLLSSLATLGEALASAPNTRIEALSYRPQVIDLRITAPNVDALDKIQQSASANGLATQIQQATPRDNKVEGRLQLKL